MERLQRIILVRHGQTTINAEKKLSGHSDPPLTEEGKEQAGRVAEGLASYKIDRLFASPMQRAVDTARAISENSALEIETDKRLIEQNFGQWEGKSYSEIFKLIPGGPEGLLRGPFLGRFPAGEGTKQFVARVMGVFRDFILNETEGQTIAVVTHSGVIVILLCHFLGIDPFSNFFRLRVDNGSACMVDRYALGLYHIQFINRTF